ncbi:hypothetical protein LCGC14_0358710 [marine sediment metagenome]|uniref:Uncharacterized protein n=1 Tax=marine sediment metagenome TaxID=412755 RepID=A0A0F9VVW8_9ZZZZ
MRLFTNDSIFRRFKRPSPKGVNPPALPSVTPPVSTELGRAAGAAEGERLRGRTGRRATRLTTPGFLRPANVRRAELKTTLG